MKSSSSVVVGVVAGGHEARRRARGRGCCRRAVVEAEPALADVAGEIDRPEPPNGIAAVAGLHGDFDVPVEHVELVAVHHAAIPARAERVELGVGEADRADRRHVLRRRGRSRRPSPSLSNVRSRRWRRRGRYRTRRPGPSDRSSCPRRSCSRRRSGRCCRLPHAADAVERQTVVVVVVAEEELGAVGVLRAADANADVRAADLADVDVALVELDALRGELVGGVALADRARREERMSFCGLNSSPKMPDVLQVDVGADVLREVPGDADHRRGRA